MRAEYVGEFCPRLFEPTLVHLVEWVLENGVVDLDSCEPVLPGCGFDSSSVGQKVDSDEIRCIPDGGLLSDSFSVRGGFQLPCELGAEAQALACKPKCGVRGVRDLIGADSLLP